MKMKNLFLAVGLLMSGSPAVVLAGGALAGGEPKSRITRESVYKNPINSINPLNPIRELRIVTTPDTYAGIFEFTSGEALDVYYSEKRRELTGRTTKIVGGVYKMTELFDDEKKQ